MLTQETAERLIEPHKGLLAGSIRGAVTDWTSLLSLDGAATLMGGLTPRTRASYVHERVVYRLLQAEASGECDGLRMKRGRGGLWVAIINDQIVLKLKKLDRELKSRNIPTMQTAHFDHQGMMPGLNVPAATNATGGYVLDPLTTMPLRLVVVCWDGLMHQWTINLEAETGEAGGDSMFTLPITGAPAGGRTRTRVIEPTAAETEGASE